MKFGKFDWILLLMVIVISAAVYSAYNGELPNGYLVLIILFVGLTIGVLKRVLFRSKQ
ncbi:hypothetical protein SAMN04488127_2132 [Bhargavaea ginsengi]|uniref:Uncharacterized protein n=1 Tax=Bhargavaea ginsengi TaxID=426757 RepID=A0A1H6ZJF9_9BACL|nr:hypothetical protein SAMN04488127_2132 [Bhargavaea ginsengi]